MAGGIIGGIIPKTNNNNVVLPNYYRGLPGGGTIPGSIGGIPGIKTGGNAGTIPAAGKSPSEEDEGVSTLGRLVSGPSESLTVPIGIKIICNVTHKQKN